MFKSVSTSIDDVEDENMKRKGVFVIGMSEKRIQIFKKHLLFLHRHDEITDYEPIHRLLPHCFSVDTSDDLKFKTPIGFISDVEKFDIAFT